MRKLAHVSACIALGVFLALIATPALASPKILSPLGIVVFAQNAQISQISARNGTSIYPGDTLSTASDGSLRILFGASQLMLGPGTVVKLLDDMHGAVAVLQHGVVRFSAAGPPIELRVLAAIVRPQAGAAGELIVVGPREFQIGSTKGSLEVDVDGVKRVVTDTSAYDVTLDPDSNCTSGAHDICKHKGLWVPIALVAILTALGLYGVTLSGSKF